MASGIRDGALVSERRTSSMQKMPQITIYTTIFCPYCAMAKQLLKRKGAAYDEIDVTGKPASRAEMSAKAGGLTTVPQIWIGETHVGGCDDLYALDHAGELDRMLADEHQPGG